MGPAPCRQEPLTGFCYVTGHSIKSKPQTSLLFRDTSHFNVDSYCKELNFTVINFLANLEELNKNNFDVKFDAFVTLILNVINKHAPIRRLSRTKQQLNSKPWISKDIYQQIRRKRQMYKSHYIKGDEAIKLEYKKFANNLTKMKTLAKKQYYANELENSRGNLRKMWELLRTLLPGKLHGSTILISNINLNGCSISNKQRIVNEFNVFFSKVGENLSKNFNGNSP